ncbi:peptide MFS transporter [Macrococcoides bohemicum]|uniref:Peptide MFS transporter n=1 Tax=Macrococcoides bohemicum TaxID=1903056 RepID=A0AAJ4TX22_9STAP|nr:peptide MFS transporter [Macrococcus bohemicus]QYA43045.1 peptide MFS transporter [Macrococcus bohemicus]QYA45399.1 peptide MFS transporter [Macrococcus bohemicus]
MAQHTREEVVNSMPRTGFFGHPKGLFTLMLTEFWERFSYYGMKAILLFYLYYSVNKGGFGLDEGFAMQIVSIYGALIYMSGVIGGWLADRFIGTRKAILYGAILIMIGHILLSLPNNFTLLLIALLFIILGTGLLKPNISTNVGELYEKNDPKVDSAFTLFVMSINMGALISPLLVGWLQDNVGFHYGFAVAAVGMFFGLIIFMLRSKQTLGLSGLDVPNPVTEADKKKTITITGIVIAAFLLYFLVTGLMGNLSLESFMNFVTVLGMALPFYYFITMIVSKKTTRDEKARVFAYVPLFLASVAFWSIQEQGSTVLAHFADKNTQLNLGVLTNNAIDFKIPAAWFQSLNPLFIVTLAPLFAWLWVKLGRFNPPTVIKFSIALFLAAMSYLVMVYPLTHNGDQLMNPGWLILSYLLVTMAELCLSPTGLSVTTKLAPQAYTSQMMSVWFLANTVAQLVNSKLVLYYEAVDNHQYFNNIGLVTLAIAVVLLLVSPFMKKFMRGIH